MVKKIVISMIVILVLAIGGIFFMNSEDKYDASKYSLKLTDGFNRGSMMTFNLLDQFDKDISLDSSTQKLIVVFSKEMGHIANNFISSQPKKFLESKGVMLVADISKMPVVIRNTFALPSLRKSEYPTTLIYDSKISDVLKNGKSGDKIFFITLENNRIKSVSDGLTAKDIESFLK